MNFFFAIIRIGFWFTAWLACLGNLSVDAEYADGLHIRLYDREERRQRRQKKP